MYGIQISCSLKYVPNFWFALVLVFFVWDIVYTKFGLKKRTIAIVHSTLHVE